MTATSNAMRPLLVLAVIGGVAGCATARAPAPLSTPRATSSPVAQPEVEIEALGPPAPVIVEPLAAGHRAPSAPPPPADQPAPSRPSTRASASLRELAQHNDSRLLMIYVGARRAEVERIMRAPYGASWPNPFRRETIVVADGKAYEVLFYVTRDPHEGRVTERHLTPVILLDNQVVGIGRYPLRKLRRGVALRGPR